MFTPEQQQEIVTKRHEIVVKYCKEKNWGEPHTLTFEQIMEIRSLPEWKQVPLNVTPIKATIGIVGSIGEDGSAMAKLLLADPTDTKPELIMAGRVGMGKTVLHHQKGSGAVVLINPTIPIPEPTNIIKPFLPQSEPKSLSPSIKSGKQLRRERREGERKEDKRKKKKK